MKIRDRIRELRRVPASELLPNPKNWRTHPKAQQDALRGVLAEVGMADAVLARELPDGSLMLIDGHLRAETAADAKVPVPFGKYDEPSMKLTVVPNRNMFMLAAAGGVAIARKADRLAYGAHAGDHTIYPDCRPEFVDAMGTAFGLCDWHTLGLHAPYIDMTKGDICKRGVELRVPYEKTWTCYVGGDKPCGQCGACTERAEAFEFAGVPDPLLAAA